MATIIRMVNHTRLDCLLGSAAGMRWGLAQAVHHARHRFAFGKVLVDQPAMRNVLADLAVESEAATATAFRVARSYDEQDGPFRRFASAVTKYWVCKRAPQHASRRSSASEATATWRSPECRVSTGIRHSTRSGKGRATWLRWTCCGRLRRSLRGCTPHAGVRAGRADARFDTHSSG